MKTSQSLDRGITTENARGSRPFSPYARPLTSGPQQGERDKSSMLWKDFHHSIKKRKAIIERFAEAALGSATPLPVLKKTLLDLRQVTLAVVEDALEIEYFARVQSSAGNRSSSKKGSRRLPPINSYNTMHEHEEIYPLSEIINDCEDLFAIPNVKVMLPANFPSIRNPFLLGKTIDELATVVPPHPEPGNVEDELKSLEILRFKRASKALLRAEAQVLNRLPLNLYEIEKLLNRMADDSNIEMLVRCVCTLIDNDRIESVDQEADLTCLLSPLFTVEAHELIRKLNEYRGVTPMRVDVKVLIKQKLLTCTLDYLLTETVPRFLFEWIQTIIGGGELPYRQEVDEAAISYQPDISYGSRRGSTTISRQGMRSSQQSRSIGLNNLTSIDHIKSYEKDDNDLTSVVDSVGGHVKTHEKIHSPSEPRRKLKMKPIQNAETAKQSSDEGEEEEEEPQISPSKKGKTDARKGSYRVGSPTEANFSPQNNKKVNMSIKRKIRQEVEKAIKEMSKSMPLHRNTDFGENGDDFQSSNFDALTSVRYELNKMQTELLRRQVLDPRHYSVASVDAVTHAKRGLTVNNLNTFDPLAKKANQQQSIEQSLMPIEIASKVIKVPTKEDPSIVMNLIFTIILQPETNFLLCTISIAYEEAIRFGFIQDESKSSLRVDTSPPILFYFTISPLIFSKLMNGEYTMEDLLGIKPEHRKRLMLNIFEQMKLLCSQLPLPKGEMILPLDRQLFYKQFAEDNVLVDLVISRNVECDGLQLQCTPIAGLWGSGIGPVTLALSDHELEVLLISQHGLFMKGLIRWESMIIIASWLAGRLHVRKVATDTAIEVLTPKPAITLEQELESVASQLTFSPRKEEEGDGDNSPNTILKTPSKGMMTTLYKGKEVKSTNQPLLMLEVLLDRHIDISYTLIDHWKARNVTKILGLEVFLAAQQDLEMMEIRITIHVPSKLTHKKLLDEEEMKEKDEEDSRNKHNYHPNITRRRGQKPKKKDLLSLEDYSSEEEEFEYDDDHVTEITLTYRLTRAELLTFGSSEVIENKKIGMSKNNHATTTAMDHPAPAVNLMEENHPEKMIWNILNRLKIHFKGSKADPYKSTASAKNADNWSVEYDRLLVRDVKTVSQKIIMLSASAIGGDILLEGRPIDTNQKQPIGKKIVNEAEIKEMVYSEGWELKLLQYIHRKAFCTLLLDKLKIVEEISHDPLLNSDSNSPVAPKLEQKLELSSYVESRMIMITRIGSVPSANHGGKGGKNHHQQAPDVDHELELGYVEITNHHTLSDLRIIIKHELDSEDLPTQYRFLYKGTSCSLRQETFRRAWECLPVCYITPKQVIMSEMGTETDDIARRRMEKVAPKEGPKIPRLTRNQRRVPGKYIPVPIPTLCVVEEGKTIVYLLNEAKELLSPGDIIRIGHPKARDYIVSKVGITTAISLDQQKGIDGATEEINLKAIEIEPEYDLLSEPDFSIPLAKNYAFPNSKNVGLYMNEKGQIIHLLKSKEKMGYRYQIPKELIKHVYPELHKASLAKKKSKQLQMMAASAVSSKKLKSSSISDLLRDEGEDGQGVTEDDNGSDTAEERPGEKILIARSNLGGGKKSSKSLKGMKNPGAGVYCDVWIWKCIPAKQDTRPNWRKLYDDGDVHYGYEYTQSEEYYEHFRVKALYSYLEILCTDSRCSYLSLYAQRVNEMKQIPVEYYMKLIFDKMTDWSPVYKKGIDRTKFIKLIRDVKAFPDLKRPARLAQLDNYFIKILKSSYGIVQKYITYPGFCQLVKELAVIRFPPKKGERGGEAGEETAPGGNNNSNNNNTEENEKDNDDQSVMTDDLSSVASGEEKKGKGRTARKPLYAAPTRSNNNNDSSATGEQNILATIDPEYVQYAYQKFILDFLMMYPTWYDEPWKEVKLVAMQKESIRYCAVTRIIAVYRGFHQRQRYLFFLRQHTILQAHIRRKLAHHRYFHMVHLLYEDYLFRMRYFFMMKIQSIVRRFLKRCWYIRVLEQVKKQQLILLRARRQKKKKINELRKKSLMYSEVKKINGVIVLLRVYRKDPRNYTKDFGIHVEAYIPKTQSLFKFPIEDPELRSYLQLLLEKPALSTGDILNKVNIQQMLITRLIVIKPNSKQVLPTIIFSRHALGQKGERILTHAISIQKEYFICRIFETTEDIAVQCYHPKTSKVFQAKITLKELHRWIRDEFITETVLQRNKEKQALIEAQEKLLQSQAKTAPGNPTLLSAQFARNKSGSPLKKPMLLNTLTLPSNDLNSVTSHHTEEILAERAKEEERKKYEVEIPAKPVEESNQDAISVLSAESTTAVTLSEEEELLQIKTLEPTLLKPTNKAKYYEWILKHLVIDTRNRKFQVLFKNQLEKSRKREMLIKIQSIWRRALVPPRILQLLDQVYLKIRSSPQEPDQCYYMNRLTGVSDWEKPKLLRHYDLPTQPIVSHWVPIYYQQDGLVYTHYVNPFTGKYTHLIPDQAARVIQRLARRYLLKLIRLPKDHFIQAANIYRLAERSYKGPVDPRLGRRKLAHVINYAIVLHVMECDEAGAKEVYREAVELSEANPLVTRCYAFYLLSTCEPPMQLNRDRALLLLNDAKRKDEDHSRFQIAFYLFELAVLRHPSNFITLVNLALVHCLLYNNNYQGEKLLRRALSLAPFEERVMEVWKFLKDRFPERHLLYNPMSRVNKMKPQLDAALDKVKGRELKIVHGRPVVENNQWAGWVYVPEDTYKASKTIKGMPYWYNPADGSESLDPPDFSLEWPKRKARSHYQVTEYGLEQYFDPLTSDYFQYHPLTDTYS